MSALMQTYARLPVTFSHGHGVYLYDTEGRRYLDGIAGIGVNALGHAHPTVTAAIRAQADKLVHTSNLYRIEAQEQLAAKLTAVAGMETCFFGNSGAEANEAAIKMARLFGHKKGAFTGATETKKGFFEEAGSGSLLLDEIAGGLTEMEVLELVDTITSIQQSGVTLVWIEHIVHALLKVVDQLLAIDYGKMLMIGDPQTVMASPAVQNVYMGAE